MEAVLLVAVLISSVVVHEVAHAWQARREGDDTAERLGRITLNPMPHLDWMGSFVVPLILHFSNAGFMFGWAKPVPVNPAKYRDPRAGDIRVSLAGIVANVALAAVATLAGAVLFKIRSVVGPMGIVGDVAGQAIVYTILINLVLAFFNLIPIPPLDGSHVLFHFLPPALARRYREAGRYGILVVMGLLFFFPGAFRLLLWPVSYLMGVADLVMRLWI